MININKDKERSSQAKRVNKKAIVHHRQNGQPRALTTAEHYGTPYKYLKSTLNRRKEPPNKGFQG